VVVGYDGSPSARAALAYAAERAGADGTVIVVHGYEPPSDWLGAPNFQRILDDHMARGRAILEGILLDGNEELLDITFETELIGAQPAEAINQVAEARKADEIAIGSRGLGRVRAALGSVSHDLLHLATRPVVVVPAAYAEKASAPSGRAGE
jgi:nucleotide-binding universal stress UspA family protein